MCPLCLQAVAKQPVAVNFEVALSFKSYWGGVYTPTEADCGKNLNHALVVVGYDTTGDTPHFILRNSWGDK